MGEAARAAQPQAPPPADAIKQRLKDIYQKLAGILQEVPRSRLDLKRLLDQQLGFRPTPQQLKVLPEMRKITDGGARSLTLQLLTVHVAVHQVLGRLTREGRLDAGALRESLTLLPPLLATSQRMETKYAQSVEAVDRLQRDAVIAVHDSLERPDAAVAAIKVVGPELIRLLDATDAGRLLEIAPDLGADEAAALRHASQRDPGDDIVARTRLNAVALRTRIDSELAGWAALPSIEDRSEEEVPEERQQAFEKLEQCKAAYRTVAEWVNETRAAHAQGQGVEDLRHAQQRLFAAYRELAKVIQAGPLPVTNESAETEPDPDHDERLREEIEQAAREGAEVDAEKEAKQDTLREAASDNARPASVANVPKRKTDLDRERRRKKILYGVAAALAPIAVLTNVLLYDREDNVPLPTPEQFSSAMPVRDVVPALTILQAEVSTFVWDSMSDPERLQKVNEMAAAAAENGYTDLHIVDEQQVERARWSKHRGAELIQNHSP